MDLSIFKLHFIRSVKGTMPITLPNAVRQLFIALVTAILLPACGPQNARPEAAGTAPDSRALQYITSHRYLDGAAEYMRLAQLYPDREIEYRLKAARAYYDGGDLKQAKVTIENTVIKADDTPNTFKKNILLTELSLDENNPETAISLLAKKPPADSSLDLIIKYHELRARAFELNGNSVRSIKERLTITGLQKEPGVREENYRKLWNALNHLNLRELRRMRQATSGKLTSWIELAMIYQANLFKPDMLQRELAIWNDHYPGHPANSFLLKEILQSSRKTGVMPQHIALCLPFFEPYKSYSEAIRDGFLSAWYSSEHYRPLVTIYNADSMNIQEIYRNAVNNGADFIVGPLEKEAIARLMELKNLPVTILALNIYSSSGSIHRDPDLSYPRLIQFDLSPEDEARQVADLVTDKGGKRALVIAPEGEWGQRLVQSFMERWQANGGKIVDYVNYQANTTDYSIPVKRLLNIAGSESRAKLLQQRLNKKIKSETRIRHDADMIFLVADQTAARQIVPQLRFYRADSIPVYSTRFLYSGFITAQLDNDINGVLFTDFPWVMESADSENPIHKIIDMNWSANTSKYNRMYALGVDAFKLIPNLDRLAAQPSITYAGETGDLYLTEDGIIKRKLLWAQFVDGKPQLLNRDKLY